MGASTATIVLLEKDNSGNTSVASHERIIHNGSPQSTILNLLKSDKYKNLPCVFTGRKFRTLVNLDNISEPEASELAYKYLFGNSHKYEAIASLGGETFIVYTLDGEGNISDVITKNQCASGTGEFFLQQIKRMDLKIDDIEELTKDAEPLKVSGRCSVFCKSDCTHALNKGMPKSEVASGLASMIADKVEELLAKKSLRKVLFVGGVTLNSKVMSFVKEKFPDSEHIEESRYFEALGAAVYALENDVRQVQDENIFIKNAGSFAFHKPLADFAERVKFEESSSRRAYAGEKCIIGLDVGSTTTKAIAISAETQEILGKIYLYTHGNPIKAARQCYLELSKQLPSDIDIIGIGTTGSGRHIAGLHCGTEAVYNEITAHSTAAVHFDPSVDTIFEIGGQDAKYTYIVNGVPADYAMNEACSAGTGSFIEESAFESLGVSVREIEKLAMKAEHPPNFSDQCAAFIGSDIKTAQQENISSENILAGLVYSVCLNYVNRVKGNRQVGKKIFMQGGVCYNKAIPIAMSALTGKEIIVPPDPGLMGAFGVALEVEKKIKLGLLQESSFDLNALAAREVSYGKSFICAGGKEKCDLKCPINLIEIEGKKYPFGGACDKYYSLAGSKVENADKYDYISKRNKLFFEDFAIKQELPSNAKKIGINNSFLTHTLYPLFYNFFTQLGCEVVIPRKVDEKGFDREISSFCYPSQLSLGLFEELLSLKPEYIFMPSLLEINVGDKECQRLDFNCTCVFVSGEPFYIKQAFKDNFDIKRFLAPNLNFANGFENERQTFVKIAKQAGIDDEAKINAAYSFAIEMQDKCQEAAYELGKQALVELDANPDKFAMVIVGRAYNSFSEFANKGIPQKYASRGIYVLPFDIFDNSDQTIDDNMFWESGKKILRAAKFIKSRDNIFSTYITNFSCAPDSMIMNSYRTIMGDKPSLTLELDSHSADAGINTRIEAALDIISNHLRIGKADKPDEKDFRLAEIKFADPMAIFVSSDGQEIPLNHKDVEIIIPSMGDLASKLFSAALRSLGFNARALEEPTPEVLKYGRSNSSGKECLPLLLMVGELMDYLENKRNGSKYVAFFTVQGAGNCRLGQYPVFIREMLKRNKIKNVAQMVLMNEDGFAGLGENFALRGIQSIIASDVLDDVRNAVLANSEQPELAIEIFNKYFENLVEKVETDAQNIYKHLEEFALNLKENIKIKTPIEKSKYIAMLGEIYVRRDGFAHKWLNRYFAEKGFVLKTAHISEWIFYVDYLLQIDLLESEKSLKKKFERQIRNFFMRDAERKIKKTLEKSGFYKFHRVEIEPLLKHSKHILPYEFKGEPGLTIGTALHEGLEKYCGIINLGPFGCMPTRFTESIALPEMNIEGKTKAKQLHNLEYKPPHVFNGHTNIPFLTIETDGNVYPQIITAKIETFALQAERTAKLMELSKNGEAKSTLRTKFGKFFK